MRLSVKLVGCFSLLILLIGSCKKDTPSGGGISSLQQGLPRYTNVFGALITGKTVNYYGPYFSDTTYEGAAIFYNMPQTNLQISTANTTSVTSVSLNNSTLYLDNPSSSVFIYEDTAINLNLTNVNWQVQSSGIIPAFSKTVPLGYPSYSGYNQLPDTINIGQNTPLKITGGLYADSLYIIVSSTNNTQYKTPNLGASVTSYTLSQASVSNLPVTNSGQLSVAYEKIWVENFNGKNFVFMKTFQFNKPVVLVNQ